MPALLTGMSRRPKHSTIDAPASRPASGPSSVGTNVVSLPRPAPLGLSAPMLLCEPPGQSPLRGHTPEQWPSTSSGPCNQCNLFHAHASVSPSFLFPAQPAVLRSPTLEVGERLWATWPCRGAGSLVVPITHRVPFYIHPGGEPVLGPGERHDVSRSSGIVGPRRRGALQVRRSHRRNPWACVRDGRRSPDASSRPTYPCLAPRVCWRSAVRAICRCHSTAPRPTTRTPRSKNRRAAAAIVAKSGESSPRLYITPAW